MDSSTATLLAAIIAAALSALSVGVGMWSEHRRHEEARQQELTRWVRERLHHVAIDFLDSAFSISGRTADAYALRLDGRRLEDTQNILSGIHRLHTTLRSALTSLSLIAPAKVVALGERVHGSHHALINYTFGAEEPTHEETWTRLRAAAKHDREQFLTALREPLGLDRYEVTIAGRARSSWRVPADKVEPKAQAE